jgi:hypothetical protein
VVFVVGGWFAFKSLDVTLSEIRWVPMVIAAVVGVPLTLVANTFEYLLSARLLHHRMRFLPALQLTTMSTAANLLPIPGAFLVRVQGLRALGSRYGRALASTAVVGLVWIGVSALMAAILLLVGERWVAAAILAAAGIRRLGGLLVAVELFAVFTNAGRLVLILIGLGVDADVDQALVLAVSSSLAAAAGILPGGFGLRELIAAALAPLVGLPASAGFAATAINRVMGIVVLAPITAALALGLRAGPKVEVE